MSHSQSEADLLSENTKLRADIDDLRQLLGDAANLHCESKAERDQLQQRLAEIEHLVPKTWYGDRELPLRVEFLVRQWQKIHEVNQNMEAKLTEQAGELEQWRTLGKFKDVEKDVSQERKLKVRVTDKFADYCIERNEHVTQLAEHATTMTNDDWVCCFCKRGMEESHRDDCVQHGGHDHLVGGNCRQPPGRVEAPCIRCALAAGIKPGALCGEHSRGAQLGDRAPTVVDGGSPKGSGAGECMCDEYGADLCVLHQTGADALAQGSGEPKPEPVVEPPMRPCNNAICGLAGFHVTGCNFYQPSPTAAPDAKGGGE